MNRLGKFITGAAIGGLIGIGAILLFAPDKRDEWFDEIQEKTQDILVEFNRAAQEYKEEMEEDLKARKGA
ncbi:MAG TPA: YtxH domain-containing protein [Flexilinea sp.]|jgi:gas vesicle protein|nr:YtxH domain-containing protein [Flexilinea sp.]OQA28304.1 MAG: YtxH-like protein [Chloroflexi bacterium ADurb.Bin344]MBP8965498.1 YtxH domain-containing protein [Flexilinea sp.]HNY19861.1 YtxH domain-containing protein [Flexilinea sp.]HNY93991.1 YtxH domain-containing protein [Flexilinea sp.]